MPDDQDPQQVWSEYYDRIRRRRIAEAKLVHAQMVADGVTTDTLLALDFLHFGDVEEDVEELAEQLSENYTMMIAPRPDEEYWDAEGTTRPDGIDGVTEKLCCDWVEFMCEVAQSYACVFSTWTITNPKTGQSWTNELIDIDPG